MENQKNEETLRREGIEEPSPTNTPKPDDPNKPVPIKDPKPKESSPENPDPPVAPVEDPEPEQPINKTASSGEDAVLQEANKAQAKKTMLVLGLSLCVLLIVIQLIGIWNPIMPILDRFFPQMDLMEKASISSQLTLFLFIYPLFYWGVRTLPTTVNEKHNWSFFDVVLMFFMMIGVRTVAAIFGVLIYTPIAELTGTPLDLVSEALNLMNRPFMLLLVLVFAPIMEEVIFRKLLIDRTLRYGEKKAILFSGLVFGLYHLIIPQMIFAIPLGMILAYVYIRTGNLWYAILLHFLNNLVSTLIPQTEGPAFYIYIVLFYLVVITGLVLFVKNRKNFVYKPQAGEAELSTAGMLLHPAMVLYYVLILVLSVVMIFAFSALSTS